MPFAVPMVWREPQNHDSDCYFCGVKLAGFSKKNISHVTYPDCQSALKPAPHYANNLVPLPPATFVADVESGDNDGDTPYEKLCEGNESRRKWLLLSEREVR